MISMATNVLEVSHVFILYTIQSPGSTKDFPSNDTILCWQFDDLFAFNTFCFMLIIFCDWKCFF